MTVHRAYIIAILCISTLTLVVLPPTSAVPGISLTRTPAPPSAVKNDGSSSITFTWTISTGANCNQNYKFEILDPGGSPVAGFPITFPCAPLNRSYTWDVPSGQACGCYQARLTFFSDWCSGSSNKFEDQATVGFLVSAAAKLRICKRWDLNGDGNVAGDPPLQGWDIRIEKPLGNEIAQGFTDVNGCVEFDIDVECIGTTPIYVREIVQTGWQKTAPSGALNPFPINLVPGDNGSILIGNWQPIIITGYKFIDDAPWPWTSPHYIGPQGQQNPPEYEPVPTCPQPILPNACVSPTQPGQQWEVGVTVKLYDNTIPLNPVLLATTLTDANGMFAFGPLQWRQNLLVVIPPLDDIGQLNPPPVPPSCNTNPADGGLSPWPGNYIGTVGTTVWSSNNPRCFANFVTPHDQPLAIPEPISLTPPQEYGCNFFYNRQPSRLWGQFCEEAIQVSPTLTVSHEGFPYPTPSPIINASGVYQVPSQSVPGEATGGLRSGEYTLLPSPVLDPLVEYWEFTTYCDPSHPSGVSFEMPSGGVSVQVPHSSDVRVDFCIKKRQDQRICFLPVTFTQQGWHDFCDPANPILKNGMIYTRFSVAFSDFKYYNTVYPNTVIIGVNKTITINGITSNLTRLCAFLPQTGTPGKLTQNYVNPTSTVAGSLAGEQLTLQLNIAYNDKRQMPRTYGYDFEKFTLTQGLFKGKTVREVRNIANAVLGGTLPSAYGLRLAGDIGEGPGYQRLVDILSSINVNYEFVNFDVFNDRGYLLPNQALGQAQPPTQPVVP